MKKIFILIFIFAIAFVAGNIINKPKTELYPVAKWKPIDFLLIYKLYFDPEWKKIAEEQKKSAI